MLAICSEIDDQRGKPRNYVGLNTLIGEVRSPAVRVMDDEALGDRSMSYERINGEDVLHRRTNTTTSSSKDNCFAGLQAEELLWRYSGICTSHHKPAPLVK